MLGALVSCLLGIVLMRIKVGKPTKKQALGEMIYDIAQTQVAEQGLPHHSIKRWFPYCATLMIFIWVVNMLGFIPLPFSRREVRHRRRRAADARGLRGDLDAVRAARRSR